MRRYKTLWIAVFLFGCATVVSAATKKSADDCPSCKANAPVSAPKVSKPMSPMTAETLQAAEPTMLWAAQSEGGIFVWLNNSLLKYDKDLNLKKSIEIKLTVPNAPTMAELLKPRCPFCPRVKKSILATEDGGVAIWIDMYILKYDKDLNPKNQSVLKK